MGRLSLARPLLEAGLLVELSPQRIKSEYAHYLVYPPRSADHAGLQAFRAWLLAAARDYTAAPGKPGKVAKKAAKKAAKRVAKAAPRRR
jgi:LysR family glycine cleavage system transcriptional activator